MSEFICVEPTLENCWRAIILFGRNVATYKFALARSLYDLRGLSSDALSLEQLAVPYSEHLCKHLLSSPKQITSKSSRFLDACNLFNQGELSKDELIGTTVKLGFNNVLDAFHIVNREETPIRFFLDERKQSGGIRITDNYLSLMEGEQFIDFIHETEARWRLVEEGWRLGVSRNLVAIDYDSEIEGLFIRGQRRRINTISCRGSLNGYQKGRCFYYFTPISVDSGQDNMADIDHFFPWLLNNTLYGINGVWNLVLACKDCNRGIGGKSARIPSLNLLRRLHKRNEYLINSFLPLRETLIQQTGSDEPKRRQFLQSQYNLAKNQLVHEWQPETRGITTF